MALESTGQRKFAQFVSHHVFADIDRHVLPSIVNRDGQTDEIGKNGRAARPGLDRALVLRCTSRLHFLHQMVVDERALLDGTCNMSLPLFAVAVTHDHGARTLVAAGFVTLRRRAPWAHRIPAGRGLAFTAAVRMVNRIHCDAANGRTHATPAHPAGLADGFQIVLFVTYLTDRGAAIHVHLAYFTGAQT